MVGFCPRCEVAFPAVGQELRQRSEDRSLVVENQAILLLEVFRDCHLPEA